MSTNRQAFGYLATGQDRITVLAACSLFIRLMNIKNSFANFRRLKELKPLKRFGGIGFELERLGDYWSCIFRVCLQGGRNDWREKTN